MNDALPAGAAAAGAAGAGPDATIAPPAPLKLDHAGGKGLEKRLLRQVGQAIGDYSMIADGDRIMVCLSGGKDSHGLLDLLMRLKERAPVRFELVAVNLDQKQPGFPAHVLPEYLTRLGVPFHIETRDTYSVVKRLIPEGATACSLCSRLRRGILYRVASELGATKIALGHHRDDLLATFFLNLFYGGRIKAMSPKLVSDDGRHVVIRPLVYAREADLARYAQLRGFPIIPCDLCGSQDDLKRREMARMLAGWERDHPGRVKSIFGALSRVDPTHLMDARLFDFAGLHPTGAPDPRGDLAFDEPPCSETLTTGPFPTAFSRTLTPDPSPTSWERADSDELSP